MQESNSEELDITPHGFNSDDTEHTCGRRSGSDSRGDDEPTSAPGFGLGLRHPRSYHHDLLNERRSLVTDCHLCQLLCEKRFGNDELYCNEPYHYIPSDQLCPYARVLDAGWRATHFYHLPEWLQDNDFLHHGHRPPLPSFSACFRSIFRIHTETGNIWSHMIGCVAFIGVAAYFLTRPHVDIQWQDKLVFSAFFVGAIACLGLSFAFHTVHCHSERMGKLFSKLDYCGITMLIVGSFIPWLFYGFYCRFYSKVVYSVLILTLGAGSLVVSLWDRFGEPKYRPVRAGMFIGLGLSGVVPCIHYLITDGFWAAIYENSLAWIALMGALYISGALLYAWRIPERFFPGRCDIWFQSHQIFHLFVVMAAFIHYHGISEMATYRLTAGSCTEQLLKQFLPPVVA